MSKHKHLMVVNRNAQGKRPKIQNWLMQEGWQVGEAQADNTAWALTATNPLGHVVVVAQPQQASDMIVLQASIVFDDSFRHQFGSLDQAARQNVLWDIRLGLLQLGVEFNGLDDTPNQFVVSQRIYDDGLTKDAFAQRLSQVKNAMLFVLWSISRKLGQPPSDNWPDNLHVN